MKKFVFLFFLPLLTCPLWAEREIDPLFGDTIDRAAEDFVTASVCIADPTRLKDDYLGVNGHAWIRLQCPVFGLDHSFTYEGESVNENLFRFLTKKTRMGLFRYPTLTYIEDYQRWNRAVHEYELHLPPEVEQRLWEIMDNHVTDRLSLPHNLERYGCSLTAVHFIENAIYPKKINYEQPSDKDLITSPAGLVEAWSRATLDGHPLITYTGDLVEAPAPTWWDVWRDGVIWGILIVLFLALIAVVIVFIKHRLQ